MDKEMPQPSEYTSKLAGNSRASAICHYSADHVAYLPDCYTRKLNGQRAPELEGCVDIDISGTPFTNTLPIRRARFTDGVPQQFVMAWVPLDSLEPFRDGQIYTRVDPTHYRYQAADGSFEQVLSIDENGFVVDYPTLFARV